MPAEPGRRELYKAPRGAYAHLLVVVLLSTALITLAVYAQSQAKKVPGGAVAIVSGSFVTQRQFEVQMKWDAIQGSGPGISQVQGPLDSPSFTACVADGESQLGLAGSTSDEAITAALLQDCRSRYEAAKGQAMSSLLANEWAVKQAELQAVSPPEEQVRAAAAQFTAPSGLDPKRDALKAKQIDDAGITEYDLMYFARAQLSQIALARITAGEQKAPSRRLVEQETRALLASPDRPKSPAQRSIDAVVTTDRAGAEAALRELRGGATFYDVLQKYSTDDQLIAAGGIVEGITEGVGDKVFTPAIFAAPLDQLVGPLQTGFGWFVFRVRSEIKSRYVMADQIRAQLSSVPADAEGAQKRDLAMQAKYQSFWRSETICATAFIVVQCSNAPAGISPEAGGVPPAGSPPAGPGGGDLTPPPFGR